MVRATTITPQPVAALGVFLWRQAQLGPACPGPGYLLFVRVAVGQPGLPLGAVGYWLTARYATETVPALDRKADLLGQVTAIVALVFLAAATIQAGSRAFTTPLVFGGYALALAAGTAFVIIERTRAQPMLPLSLLRSRAFSTAVCAGLLINVVFYGLIFAFSRSSSATRACRRCPRAWRSSPSRCSSCE
jgi:hypothetical protein